MIKKRILVLGPHVDDGEWGAGASICKWLEQGHDVFYSAFSAAEESVREEFSSDILRHEIHEAGDLLKLPSDRIQVFNHRVRFFPRDRQDILEEMIRLRAEIKPDIVLLPSSFDTHQDHEVINREGFRAFKRSTILGYEIPWNNRHIDLTYFNKVELSHVDAKVCAIGAYKSQLFRAPNYEDLIRSLAIQRGGQISVQFAEAFEVIRWVEN
jgi:LmbE family N-acetylglucosaminyl deacetylase